MLCKVFLDTRKARQFLGVDLVISRLIQKKMFYYNKGGGGGIATSMIFLVPMLARALQVIYIDVNTGSESIFFVMIN